VSSWRHILETQQAGAKVIVVDPRCTRTASGADLWLQVRPGTDAALLMAMLNVIIGEGLHDRDFVTRYSIGFDALADRVKECTPEWAAPITWVPAEKIAQAARWYSTLRPATSSSYVGIDQTSNSVAALQARFALMAITGNLDVPGGDFGRPPTPLYIGEAGVEMYDSLPIEQKRKQLGADRYPLLSWHGYEAIQENVSRVFGRRMTSSHHCFAHAPSVFAAAITGKPYQVRAIITAANNPVVTMPNALRVKEALAKLDLYVVADSWMTPSARLADFVLPTASFLERPAVFSGSDTAIFITGGQAAMPNVVPGEWERPTDYDLWRGLGVRLGQEQHWPWKDLEEAYDYRLSPLGHTVKSFAQAGGHMSLKRGLMSWRDVGFATPSGKFELSSSILERLGRDPLPAYVEPAESPVSTPEVATEFPLVLTTGGRFNVMYHSEHRQIEGLRRMHPDPLVQIHPQTASALGVADGDWVVIETRRGAIRQRCTLFAGIDPRVVHAEHGWWFPERKDDSEGPLGGLESNVNVLTDDAPEACNPVTGGWPLRAMLCRVLRIG